MAIIVRFFFHLILLSCISVQYSSTANDLNYIRCLSRCPQTYVYFTDLLNIFHNCRPEDSYDDALTCSVTYKIYFDRGFVQVGFTASNDTFNLDEQTSKEILTQTTELKFYSHNDNAYEISRTFTCNTKEDCAFDFYNSTISALTIEGKATLDSIKSKLFNASVIVGEGSKRRCTDSRKTGNKTSTKCPDGYCYAHLENYEFDQEKNTKTQACKRPADEIYLKSEIERHSPPSTQGKETLEYVCNKNVCNRNDFIEKIQDLMNDYIQWNPNQAAQVEEDIVPDSPGTMEKTGKNFSLKQTISSSILVSFVILLQFFI